MRFILLPFLAVFAVVVLLGLSLVLRNQKANREVVLKEIAAQQTIIKQILDNQVTQDHQNIAAHNRLLQDTTNTIVCLLTRAPEERTETFINFCLNPNVRPDRATAP